MTTKSLLHNAVRDFIFQQGMDKTYWIAYSGGLDSHVLLSICNALRQEYPVTFRVIHVNHHLSPHAQKWAQHCADICQNYAINFLEKKIQIDLANGDSLEALAREKRYAVIAECLEQGDVLLTAHQQDDQAETVLLQLLRGAGTKGLAAMPILKPLAHGFHGRPLLNFTRNDLHQYAEAHDLKWIEDESNQQVKYSRNFIRHDILPKLKARWPAATNALARSALHCAESQVLLEEFSLNLLKNVKGSNEKTLSVAKLLFLNESQQRLTLRSWITLNGFPLPDTKKIEIIRKEILQAASDRMPCIVWAETEVRRYRDDLYVLQALKQHKVDLSVDWNFKQPLNLSGIGILSTKLIEGMGLKPEIQQVTVRFRRGGEMIPISGRGRHTLKNLFQEWNVPTWERDRLPLLFVDEKCICAVGYFIDDDYIVKKDEIGYQPYLSFI